jgi:diguanylate cyclase (GGDEF)-like protein/PAS domain S-box-containing protein
MMVKKHFFPHPFAEFLRPFRTKVRAAFGHVLLTLVAKIWMRGTYRALSDLGIFQKSYVGALSFPNSLWEKWGYSPEDMQGTRWHDIVHPEDRARVVEELERQLAEGDSVELPEFRVLTAYGKVRWIYSRGRVLSRNASGEVLNYIGHDVDITSRKEMERMLELLREAGAIITSTLDSDEVIERVLDQAERFVPYDTAAVLLLEDDALELVAGRGWSREEEVEGLSIPIPGANPNTKVLEGKQAMIVERPAEHYPDFDRLADSAVQCWMGVPLIAKGEAIGMVTFDNYTPGTFTDSHRMFASMLAEQIAQALHNARTFEHIHREATFDPLTGVLTRRALYGEARKLLSHARRHGEPAAVLMIDLDHFKQFNDTYGHAEGDEALTVIARTAGSGLRPFDLFGRYGGEEFAVVLPRSGENEAILVGERLRRSVENTPIGAAGRTVTISLGSAMFDAEEEEADFDEILRRADKALYEAKHRGRNLLVCYSDLEESYSNPA